MARGKDVPLFHTENHPLFIAHCATEPTVQEGSETDPKEEKILEPNPVPDYTRTFVRNTDLKKASSLSPFTLKFYVISW
jgi:hypothetical protein